MSKTNIPNRMLTGLLSSALALSMAGIVGCSSQQSGESAANAGSTVASQDSSTAAADAGSFLEQGIWVISHEEDPLGDYTVDRTYATDGRLASYHESYIDYDGSKATYTQTSTDIAEDGSNDLTTSWNDEGEQTSHVERTVTIDENALTAQLVEVYTSEDEEPTTYTTDYTFYANGTIKTITQTFSTFFTSIDEDGNETDPEEATVSYISEFDEKGNHISTTEETLEGDINFNSSSTVEFVYDEAGNAISATSTQSYGDDMDDEVVEYTFDVDENGHIVAVYQDGELTRTIVWTYIEHPTAINVLDIIFSSYISL